MSVKAERSSCPAGVKSEVLPWDERSRYSVPRNVTFAVAGAVGPGGSAAAASVPAVAARAMAKKPNAKKKDRCFLISSLLSRMPRRSHLSGVAGKV